MKLLKMILFQLKLYVKNSYFVSLVLIETSSMLLYEYLANFTNQSYSGKEWLIAGIMGMWASCTTSAGALGFQQWQGTLAHLLNSGLSSVKVLISVLSPAAIYGLISFPLAGLEARILNIPVDYFDLQLLVGIILFWFASTVLSYFISLLFILSRNAFEYEELILLPILLLSGMLATPAYVIPFIKPIQLLSPLSFPIRIIYHHNFRWDFMISYLLIILLFIVISKLLTNIVIKRAFKEGRLNIF